MENRQYVISGGQLYIDKKVFAVELLKSDSIIKKIMSADSMGAGKPPRIIKGEDRVTVDYNSASDIEIGENYEELFKALKSKYREKIKGRLTLRVTFLTSFHMVIDFNSEDEQICREM